MQERQRSLSVVQAWTSCRVQVNYPCTVCHTGVGNNSIYCNGCKLWVHKKCSGLQRLHQFLIIGVHGAWEMPAILTADQRVKSRSDLIGYLGDILSAGGGCEITVITRVKTAWKKFRKLLPVLRSRYLSYKTPGHIYSSCMQSDMLHASTTWPLTKTNLQPLQRNDGPDQTDLQYQGHGKVKQATGKACI